MPLPNRRVASATTASAADSWPTSGRMPLPTFHSFATPGPLGARPLSATAAQPTSSSSPWYPCALLCPWGPILSRLRPPQDCCRADGHVLDEQLDAGHMGLRIPATG